MKQRLFLKLLFLCSITTTTTSFSQELIPFSGRQTFTNFKGDLTVIGNDMVGALYRSDNDTWYDPNAAYDENDTANGNYLSAYIDIDNDPATFSSSSADLILENSDCSQIAYAGLYWSANYYMARRDNQRDFTQDAIASNSDTRVALSINNGPFAGSYTVRGSEFGNDNTDIKLSPVSSYLVVAQPENGCGITNGADLSGNIAVIRKGAFCNLREKVVNAQQAGAVGVIIVNDLDQNLPKLEGNAPAIINIPSVSIGNMIRDVSGNFRGDLITLLNNYNGVVLATLSTTGNAQLTALPLTDSRKIGVADFRNIKFKVPGGNYQAITAQNVIWDGYANTSTNQQTDTNGNFIANDEVQYVCYAEVTDLINPYNQFGTYTVADMKATQGYTSTGDGACGGWMLVVVYEDQNLPTKFISTQDGYVQIFAGDPPPNPVDFRFEGFQTPPAPAPVNITFGISALEGDKRWIGDQLQVKNAAGNFVSLGDDVDGNVFTDVNPTTNFFNSSISTNGTHTTLRNPASTNTLGFDIDLFKVPNPGNILVGNEQNSADFRILTEGDRYSVFFNVFSMASAEPEMVLVNRVFDETGTIDITGGNVEPGDHIFYELQLQNTGNEDLVDGSVFITNILPTNTNLIEVAQIPNGVTFVETVPGTVVFNIPSDLVETDRDGEGTLDEPIVIRIKAEIVTSCEELRDTCSDEIINNASVTYTGEQSALTMVTQSIPQLFSCGVVVPVIIGNSLVNIPPCSQEVASCSDSLTLVSAAGYDRYTWTGPGIVTPIVQLTANNPNANALVVSNPQTGIYLVLKEDTDPNDGDDCMTLTEEFDVLTPADIKNPLIESADELVSCTVTGENYPVIFIADQNGQDVSISLTGIYTITWQKLDEINCGANAPDNCPTVDPSCSNDWITICQTVDCVITDPGEYRVIIEFSEFSDCTATYYFRGNRVLDVVEQENTNFRMYPNPANNFVHISSGNTSIKNIMIKDLTGKTLIQTSKNTFDIHALDKGVYFVHIKTQKTTSILKLIKE